MATLSELVKAIAGIQGHDENHVLWIARHLREDGLISKGGRGRGGAKMNTTDATRLLIGVNAPGGAKQSADLVRIVSAMPLIEDYAAPSDPEEWKFVREGDDFSEAFKRETPFGTSMQALIVESMKDGLAGQSLRVTISGPALSAHIYLADTSSDGTGDVWTSAKFSAAQELVEGDGSPPDQDISRSFTRRTIDLVAQILLK